MLIQQKLAKISRDGLIRKRKVISERDGNNVIVDGQVCINFCSNDYLGLTTSSKIKQSLLEAVQNYGFGSGSSAMISGYYAPQQALEVAFADFLQRDQAIFFGSGYLANIGVMSALGGRDRIIVSDKLCHASILDGIQLSRSAHYRFPHHNLVQLDALLKKKIASTGRN